MEQRVLIIGIFATIVWFVKNTVNSKIEINIHNYLPVIRRCVGSRRDDKLQKIEFRDTNSCFQVFIFIIFAIAFRNILRSV